MSSELADVAAADAPHPAPMAAAVADPGRALVTLMRRELWEHRALWMAPVAVAILVALCAVPAHVSFDDVRGVGGLGVSPEVPFAFLQWALSVPLYLVMLIVVPFYLLDCLYAERKDRSILFWKSLPVSDRLTVLSKLLVALVLVPLGVFVLALLTHLVFTGIWNVRVLFGNVPAGVLVWNTLVWVKVQFAMLLALLLAVLWYAPMATYLLLVSAWARRAPFLWALLPPVLAPLLERIAFGTTYLWHALGYRSYGIWQVLAAGIDRNLRHTRVHSPDQVLDNLNFGAAFADLDVWIGLAVAAAMVFAAVRLRRYRDDT
jgi:ABC-2 type transport system permease protein